MYNILVVDDDKEIVKAIEIYLEKENYFIYKAYDGEEALKQINDNVINLIIMDIMMPRKDGIETLEEIRKNKDIPVILLSAKSEDIDKINGLNIGADDYITKPFSTRELIARINRIILKENQNLIIKIKDIEFDIDKMVVLKNSKEVSLTSLELKILNLLFTNLNKVVKREDIIEKVWEWTGNDINDNTVTVYLKRIREKLDSDIIKTIKGIGYRVDGE